MGGGSWGNVSSFFLKSVTSSDQKAQGSRDIFHSRGLAKIGQETWGRNVTAFGTNYCSESKCHTVTNRPIFSVGISDFWVDGHAICPFGLRMSQ